MGEEEYVCPHCGHEIHSMSNLNAAIDMLEMKVAAQKEAIDMLITQVDILRQTTSMWKMVGK